MCTSEGYREPRRGRGVGYLHETTSCSGSSVRDAGIRGARDGVRMLSVMTDAMRVALQDQWAAAETMRPDLVVYHPKSLGGYHIAEKLAVPGSPPWRCLLHHDPGVPHPVHRRLAVARPGRPTELSVPAFTAVVYGKMINDFRRSTLRLAPIGRFDDLPGHGRRQAGPDPVRVQPARPSGTPTIRATSTSPGTGPGPRPQLAAVVAVEHVPRRRGPPLYIGFGSMGFGGGAHRRRDAIVAAVQTAREYGPCGRPAGTRRSGGSSRRHLGHRPAHTIGCYPAQRPSCTMVAREPPAQVCEPASRP